MATTSPLRPTSAANTLWEDSTVTNIDDPVTQPTTGDNAYAYADRQDDFEKQEWNIDTTNLVAGSTITSITMYIEGYSDDDQGSGSPQNDTWHVDVYAGGAFLGEQTISLLAASGVDGQYSATFSGLSLDADTDFSTFKAAVETQAVGGGDWERLDVLYLTADYTEPTITEPDISGIGNDGTVTDVAESVNGPPVIG